MVATPLSSLFLGLCCIAAIAAVGCVFELSSGAPQLGSTITTGILALAVPATAVSFWMAVRIARESLDE